MIIKVRNFGPIKSASFNTERNLTVFCGPNSSGKTYASYLFYAIFSCKFQSFNSCEQLVRPMINRIRESGSFAITRELLDKSLEYEAKNILKSLGVIFGISDESVREQFGNAELHLSLSDTDFGHIIQHCGLKTTSRFNNVAILLDKKIRSSEVSVSLKIESGNTSALANPIISDIIGSYLQRLAHFPVAKANMQTVERNSILTFKNRLPLIDDRNTRLQTRDDENYESGARTYPLAVSDSIRIAKDLTNVVKYDGELKDIAENIEKRILKGRVLVSDSGDVSFIPDSMPKGKSLPFHQTSSVVKSLSSIIIYLRYLSEGLDYIIMDEPEMNLHPENQRLMVRMFAGMANKDFKVLVSTHSDFLIREFNNLIMLGNKSDALQEAAEKTGYDMADHIPAGKFGAYFFDLGEEGEVTVHEIPVNTDGFEAQTLDDTIARLNNDADEIYFALRYGKAIQGPGAAED